MPYITELHCHTSEISNCADARSEIVVQKYIDSGYTSLTVMNHLSRYTFFDGNKHKYQGGDSWSEKIAFFMNGVDIIKKLAGDRLNVLWGIELRSNLDQNDYLIYGIDTDFLLANPDIMDSSLKSVGERVHDAGCLIFQAHPFRNTMQVKKPSLLDGIETYNGHIKHDSRNDIALMWAKKYGLRQLSGTDLHHEIQNPSGGIITEKPLTTNAELLEVLKSGNYKPLLCGEEPLGKVY